MDGVRVRCGAVLVLCWCSARQGWVLVPPSRLAPHGSMVRWSDGCRAAPTYLLVELHPARDEELELDDACALHHHTAGHPHELDRRTEGAASGHQVVDHQHALALLDGVARHAHTLALAVLHIVRRRLDCVRHLAL